MSSFMTVQPPVKLHKLVGLGTAVALLGLTGCSSGVAPSRTVSGAGTGALIGGAGGALAGGSSSMGTGTGAALGAGAGALVGGLVGMVQDARDRKEQDRLAQERAYQQELAKKRQEEVKLRAEMDEELAIAQGFRISELELNDAQKKLEVANEKLKRLMDERSTALKKKKDLDETREKTLAAEAKAAQLEEELARLKGEDAIPTNVADSKKSSTPPPAKPGSQ
jgi:osmotically inducible lipoprotein OsmB